MSNYVNLLDIVYPVGSVYITFSDVSPVDSIGGSWDKIDGKFLQSSSETDSLNSTGGYSSSIELTLQYCSWYYNLATLSNADADKALLIFNGNTPVATNTETAVASSWHHDSNSSSANSLALRASPTIITKKVSWDNRPAYITCNMYKRTA